MSVTGLLSVVVHFCIHVCYQICGKTQEVFKNLRVFIDDVWHRSLNLKASEYPRVLKSHSHYQGYPIFNDLSELFRLGYNTIPD